MMGFNHSKKIGMAPKAPEHAKIPSAEEKRPRMSSFFASHCEFFSDMVFQFLIGEGYLRPRRALNIEVKER